MTENNEPRFPGEFPRPNGGLPLNPNGGGLPMSPPNGGIEFPSNPQPTQNSGGWELPPEQPQSNGGWEMPPSNTPSPPPNNGPQFPQPTAPQSYPIPMNLPNSNVGGDGYTAQPAQEIKAPMSALSIASFITSLTCCLSFIAIPLGAVALVRNRRHGYRGSGLAIAGLIIGVLMTIALIGTGVMFSAGLETLKEACDVVEPTSEDISNCQAYRDFEDALNGETPTTP